MASPFKSFRKNQKIWLAILGVVCMVTFVLVPGTVRVGCGQTHQPERAVETKLGSVTMAELQGIAQQREWLDAFALELDMTGLQAMTQALYKRSPTPKEQNDMLSRFSGFRPSMSRAINGGQRYREALDTWLKVQKANDLGIKVDQGIISDYITTRSGGGLSRQALDRFLKQHGIGESDLYRALGNELLAERVDDLYGFGQSELSPAEHKELFDREHRRANVEAVAFDVKDFVGLVEEPTDETLKEFFDRYRERLPNPESPEPGFRLPYLAQFQYLWVSQPRLYEAAMKAITDAEIAKRYDELVKAKNTLDGKLEHKEEDWKKSLTTPEKEGDKKDPGKTAPAKSATEKPAAEKAATEKPGTDKAKTDKAKTDQPKADAKTGNPGAAATPGETVPGESQPRAAFPVALAREGDGAGEVPVTLAQADPAAKTPGKTAADAKTPAADAKTTDAKTTDAKTTDAKTEKPPEKSKEPAKAGDGAESKIPGLKLPDPFKAADRRLDEIFSDLNIPEDIRELAPGRNPPQFKPLWAVEATLREELAKDMARADAQRLLELIKEPLDKHFKEYERWAKRKKGAPPVNPLDDPASARALIDDAWKTWVEGKKTAWKTSFEERKKFVDAEIKRLKEEKQLTSDSKDDEWQKLLTEQKQLADADKLAAATLDAWQAQLSKKRTNLEPEAATTTPEKKEAASAAEKKPAGKQEDGKQEDGKKEEGKKEEGKADAGKSKAADAKKSDAKKSDAKKSDAKKSDDKKSDDKKSDDKLEPTDPVISLEKTDAGPVQQDGLRHGLDLRDFRRHKYKLATTQVMENQSSQEFLNGPFERAAPFQPTLASALDDKYLFWKTEHRPSELLHWEDPRTQTVVATTRDMVLEAYRLVEARELVLSRAQELAKQIGQESRTFPLNEVLRLFRLDGQGGTSAPDRASLSLTGANTTETYAVVAEVFEDGDRRPLSAGSSPAGPLEAPAPSVFGDLDQARQQAANLAAAHRDPKLLVIVGKAVGQDKTGLVFQGVQGFRWQAPEKDSSAGDETKNVVSGPGRLAGKTFSLKVGSGADAKTVEAVGRRLEPFTWDQIAPLARQREDDPGIPGLIVPGEVFADTVFRLQPGEVAAALNQPRNIAYVAQVTGYEYSVPGGVYPADAALEKGPVREAFISEWRQEDLFRRFGVRSAPAAQAFRRLSAFRQYQGWRDALYAEFAVKNDGILDRTER